MGIAEDRARIQEALQASTTDETDDRITGAVVTGWVVVAEVMNPHGEMWVTRLDAEHMTSWKRDGMLHQALYGEWERAE